MGNFSNKLRKFMRGRYGYDKFSYALLIIAAVLAAMLFNYKNWITFTLITLPMAFAVYRAMSRNIAARAKENRAFERVLNKSISAAKKYLALQKNKFRDRKTHRYLRCPKCGNILRLPRGKGSVTVKCPVCGDTFDAVT